jgi:organic radical activating enzyme
MKFIIGRDNLAATVFVPYDCKNNCSFCTTKHEYSDMSNFSIDRIIEQLKVVNNMPDVRDIVFTGGEPFADIKLLKQMLDVVSPEKHIFVNTTLPMDTAHEAVEFINNSRINSVNISRHIDGIISRKSDFLFDDIEKSIKINCVIFRDYTDKEVLDFIEKYKGHGRNISFRADYRNIDKSNLSVLTDTFFQQVAGLELTYLGSSGCSVCNTDSFLTEDGFYVTYHRGIENSALKVGKSIMVNDIIIKQDGSMYYDWNYGNEEIDEMIKQFTYDKISQREETEFIVQGMVENDIISKENKESAINYLRINKNPNSKGNCGRGRGNCGRGNCGYGGGSC